MTSPDIGGRSQYESVWFNPPPNWPVEPGFVPHARWKPDPSWPPAPTGWSFWVGDEEEPTWGGGPPEERDEPPVATEFPAQAGNGKPILIAGAAALAAAGVTAVVLSVTGVLSSKEGPPNVAIPDRVDIQYDSGPTGLPSQPAADPETASLTQLRQIADRDRPYVADRLADVWVPQLSSKRPGIVDEGKVWDNVLTLQEHLRLRDRYGAKLLWSGEWSTFDAPNFWVTVAPVTFSNADGALRWCTREGFDALHCYAKLVSTTHPVRGSTAHNE